MPISETIYFVITFGLSVVFSTFAMVLEENKILLKILAGLCWFILALMMFIVGDVTSGLTLAFSMLFWGLGFMFWAWTTKDWFQERKGEFGRSVTE